MHVCFPVILSRLEIGVCLQHLQSTTWVIPVGLSHQALVTLLALQSTDSSLSSWKGICNYCTNRTPEERSVILKALYMKKFQWKQTHFLLKKLKKEQDRACTRAHSEPQRIQRSTQKMGHKFKVTAMRNSCWLYTLQQQVYPGPRGLSQLCQWPTDLQDHLSGHKLHTAFPVLLPRSSPHTDNTGLVMD